MLTPIVIIPDQMLPESTLPHLSLAAQIGLRGNFPRRGFLDFTSTRRVVIVVLGQPPNAMQVIRQHDHGLDCEASLYAHIANGGAQGGNPIRRSENRATSMCNNREEERAATQDDTTVIAHGNPFLFVALVAIALRMSAVPWVRRAQCRVNKRSASNIPAIPVVPS
jgi:hypothetical protein